MSSSRVVQRIAVVLLFTGLLLSAVDPAHGEVELSRLVESLRDSDPFVSAQAVAEIRKLGTEAIRPLLPYLSDSAPMLRFQVGALVEELLEEFLLELDRELHTLHLDRRDLTALQRRREAAEELKELRKTFDTWKGDLPELPDRLKIYFALEALQKRRQELKSGATLEEEESAELQRLEREVAEYEKTIPDLEKKAETTKRIAMLEAVLGPPLTEKELLRLAELEKRVKERQPRVDVLTTVLSELGPPAYTSLAAHLEFLPLQTSELGTVESATERTYREILREALDQLRESKLFPAGERLLTERYQLSLLWALEIDTSGPARQRAQEALDRHLQLTLDDLESPRSVVHERAAVELYRLGKRGLAALESAAVSSASRFLAGLLRWRIHPSDYSRFGIDFNDYDQLSFTARRRKVFQYARTVGLRATPTLRAIVRDDSLESSFLVKYAAAKALITYAGDRAGFLLLQSQHPEMVLRRPEVSRDLLLLQGLAYVRAKNYSLAVREFAKILEIFPFDFDANYHIAFAYLLLTDYPRSIHHFEIARRVNPNDRLTLYNLACAYSLGGKHEEALEALDASVNAGFKDADHMERDSDLEPIRNMPRYQKIVEKARRQQ